MFTIISHVWLTSAPAHCIVYLNAYTAPGAPRQVKFYLQISGIYEYDIQINIFRFWDWLNKNLSNRNAKWRRLWKFSREAIQISNFSRGGRRPPLNRSEGGAAPLRPPLNTPLIRKCAFKVEWVGIGINV